MDAAAAAAKKIADKYIDAKGGKPRERAPDSYEFGPEPRAGEADAIEKATRAAVRMELEERAAEARMAEARADIQRKARVARAMKKKHIATGGWQTHPDILEAVTHWSSKMKLQRWMASQLGKTLRAFEEAMHKDKGENPLRLAYESGRADAEQRHIDICEQLDPSDSKQTVAWIFYMKAQMGWKDKPDVSTNDGPKITFLLPGPMTEEAYYKSLGIEGPTDTRVDSTRQLGGVKVGDMKDVTPDASGKMPTLGAQKILSGGK